MKNNVCVLASAYTGVTFKSKSHLFIMTTLRLAEMIKERTQAKWSACVEAANNIQVALTMEKKRNNSS